MTIHSTTAPGPRALVASADRHGGTRQIAAAIARGLSDSQAPRCSEAVAVLSPAERRPDPAGPDTVVLGSAVREGRWLQPAELHAPEVAGQRRSESTRLFWIGLAPAPHPPIGNVDDARRLAGLVGAHGDQRFAGRVERRLLPATERAASKAASRAAGAFRDRGAVRAWSEKTASDVVKATSLAAAG